jgi:hypothetical protein
VEVVVLWIVTIQAVLKIYDSRIRERINSDERGSTVETVILTALLAGLAISVAAIIILKVTARAHSIDLNN